MITRPLPRPGLQGRCTGRSARGGGRPRRGNRRPARTAGGKRKRAEQILLLGRLLKLSPAPVSEGNRRCERCAPNSPGTSRPKRRCARSRGCMDGGAAFDSRAPLANSDTSSRSSGDAELTSRTPCDCRAAGRRPAAAERACAPDPNAREMGDARTIDQAGVSGRRRFSRRDGTRKAEQLTSSAGTLRKLRSRDAGHVRRPARTDPCRPGETGPQSVAKRRGAGRRSDFLNHRRTPLDDFAQVLQERTPRR